jgi:hypothetical protein
MARIHTRGKRVRVRCARRFEPMAAVVRMEEKEEELAHDEHVEQHHTAHAAPTLSTTMLKKMMVLCSSCKKMLLCTSAMPRTRHVESTSAARSASASSISACLSTLCAMLHRMSFLRSSVKNMLASRLRGELMLSWMAENQARTLPKERAREIMLRVSTESVEAVAAGRRDAAFTPRSCVCASNFEGIWLF